MRRRHVRAVAVAGLAATVAGLWIATSRTGQARGGDPGTLVKLLAVCGVLVAAYLLWEATRSRSSDGPAPWSEAGPIVETPPEAKPDSPPLTGWRFADSLAAAIETARKQRRIEAGLAVVRDPLRDAYLEAVQAGGVDLETAERELAAGSWTNDPQAAAVLSPEVSLPRRSLRGRIADWLYPGRAAGRMARRAADAVARAGDEQIPTVVGQDAPRNVPVYQPSLASVRRGPEGKIRDPDGSRRQPQEAGPEKQSGEVTPGDVEQSGEASPGNEEPAGETTPGNEDPTGKATRDEVRSP